MRIRFAQLAKLHFPLLLKWLETEHVKVWWDYDVKWTKELIENKYCYYVNGYKIINGIQKAIYSFVIYLREKPIGYIQYYNREDFIPLLKFNDTYQFSRTQMCSPLISLIKSGNAIISNYRTEIVVKDDKPCASLDLYIGEIDFLSKNIGSKILSLFCLQYVFRKFDHLVVEPDIQNVGAIKAYERAGFKKIEEVHKRGMLTMIKHKENLEHYKFIEELKELLFIKKIILFGSRARADNRERGDIDIAIFCPEANNEDWIKVIEIINNADTLLKIDYLRSIYYLLIQN